MDNRAREILLVDDSPGDVRLTLEAFKESRITNRIHAVGDGVQALSFLRREGKFTDAPSPDLILLDLNMPRKDGRETLAEIKQAPALRRIPVVVLTTSAAEEDISLAYSLGANCYITKPVDLDGFSRIVNAIDGFWFNVARLPPR